MADRWINRLGSLHQYQNVDYVDHFNDGTVRCNLCGTGYMDNASRKKHFHGQKHLKKYNAVKAAEIKEACYQKVNWFGSYIKRINALSLPRWKHHVQSQMFLTIYPYDSTEFPDSSAMSLYEREKITKLLQKYEHMEITSLLELALWKSNIISSDLNFSSMQEMREYPILDSEFNPEEYAFNKRMTCGSAVVIPLVMSFLW